MSLPGLLEDLLDDSASSLKPPNKLANTLLRCDTTEVQNLREKAVEKCLKALNSSLDRLDPSDGAFARCLSALQRVCGIHEVLPESHKHSYDHLDVSSEAIVIGYRADFHEGTSDLTKVHVKKMRDSLEPKNPELFYHEVVLLKRIRHPNIISFYGATLAPRQLILGRMEHGDLISFRNQHPKANRLGLLNDVAEGLKYLHQCDVILGCIRGLGVFVDQHCRAQLADFAFAEIHSNQGTPRRATDQFITLDLPARWTAPEILEGNASPNKMADIYSFAMLMVEVFTGKLPFSNLRIFQLPLGVRHRSRPELPDDPLLTDDVRDLITDCWRSEVYDRPGICEVLQTLTRSLLRSLHQSIESPLELQVALSQFYDSTERMNSIEKLDKAELRGFVNFLDDMLHNEELREDIRQRTRHSLREVCRKRIVLPDSCWVTRQISKVSTEPHAKSIYAEVWEGRAVPEEGSGPAVDVCIKVLKSKDVHKRFYGEVAVWAKLDHQNIVRCFGMAVDCPQIVTGWMPNGQAITYARGCNATDRVSLLINIAHGLEYLHSRGVIHGNLKHENILLDSEYNARLSDIGFAELLPAEDSGFDWAPFSAGGCRWVAPEVFQKGELTKQSDIFAYGFIAAEIFLGEFLWGSSDETEVRSKISKGQRPILPEREENDNSARDLRRLFATCWGTDPSGRVSISEALRVLKHIPLKISFIWKAATDQGNNENGQERINELDKILGAGMVSHKERPRILNKLCKLCDGNGKLPGSMLVAYESLKAQSAIEGKGGFGVVHRGKYDEHEAAIKVLKFDAAYDRDRFLSNFCREAIMWRHLRHPNILPLLAATFDTFKDPEPKLAFVAKWMKNGNIMSFVKENDVNRARLLVDVAHGLQYLHSFNFVHGDLKGANVLINDDRHACLADFGLSTIASLRVSNDSTAGASGNPETSLVHHSTGGTKQWMSPELLEPDFLNCDPRPTAQSDCYALGMVIYEVLCGKDPYEGQALGDHPISVVINDLRPNEPDDKAALGFTDGLWWTVKCCWLKDRDMRPDVSTILARLDYAAWAWEMRRSPRILS